MSDLKLPAINQVALAGRLVQDPEFRITENGTARLVGRIAVNRAYRDRNDEWQDESSFFNFVAWSRLAERLSDRLQKGTPVFLSGRLRSHSWRDDEENPHTIVEIQARSLQVLERSATDEVDPDEIDADDSDGTADAAETGETLQLAA